MESKYFKWITQNTALILIVFFNGIQLFSQTKTRLIDEIGNKEGIIQPNVIFQDHNGFIWFGGTSSLQRYDGYKTFDYDQINALINDISEDARGILWIGTVNGIYLLNPENEKLMHFNPYPGSNVIYEIIEDKNEMIWCATFNGLLRLEPKLKEGELLKEKIFKEGMRAAFAFSEIHLDTTDDSSGANRINQIYEDSQGRLWAGGAPGLFILAKDTNDVMRIDDDINGHSRLNHQHVYGLEEEDPDVIWVQTAFGFTRISNIIQAFENQLIDKAKLHFNHYPHSSNIRSTHALKIDSKNNIWIGALELFKMNIDNNLNGTLEDVNPEIATSRENPFDRVNSITEDRTGLLWIAHAEEDIWKFREGNELITRMDDILDNYDVFENEYFGFYKDSDGNLWICNYGSGLFKISKEGTISHFATADPAFQDIMGNYAYSLLEIEKDIFWVGVETGIRQFDTRTGKSQNLVTLFPGEEIVSLVRDMIRMEDYVLVRTASQGLWLFDLKSRTYKIYAANPNDSLGLQSNYIWSINQMRNGEIWVYTTPRELTRIRLDKTTGELVFLPLPETIAANSEMILEGGKQIMQIYEDKEGILWFAAQTGLIKLDIESGEVSMWTEEDGLYHNAVRFIVEDNNGYLWLGTQYGLSVLDPQTGIIRSFDENNGLYPEVVHNQCSYFKNDEGLIYVGGYGFYRINPDYLFINYMIPSVVITDLYLFNKPVQVDSSKKAILTNNIAYTHEMDLAYNQNDLSFTFAALDYNDPSRNRYAYILEGYQGEWIETGAANRIATYTNLSPGRYVFRVRGSNNDGVWNEEGTSINIRIHPPPWKTVWAYVAYGIIFLLLIRMYIFWRTRRLRKEKILLEKQVSERTADLKSANTKLQEQQDELQEVNVLLEEQKEELMQQKEELQSTLENLQKTQEQLIESEKMAALGGLVAGVAHEINTPVGIGITAISSMMDEVKKMAELFRMDQISRQDFKEFLQSNYEAGELIQKNLQRTASLVQSFKQVSVDQVSEQQREFGFRNYLNDILMSLQPKFGSKKINFNIDCDEKLKLNSYPGVFAQIFTNLILNSLQHGFAERDTGIISIKADKNKEWLKIQYSDNGSGISKADLPHIFEPFYTSDQRRGTGLGLNIIYNLVRQKLHGTIACESETGKGVLFMIEVPVI